MSDAPLKEHRSHWIAQAIFHQCVSKEMMEVINSEKGALGKMNFEVSFKELSYLMGLAWMEGWNTHEEEIDLETLIPWRSMDSAPKDGTKIVVWIEPIVEAGQCREHAHATTAYWTDHNDGGWVWHGLAGKVSMWVPHPEEQE